MTKKELLQLIAAAPDTAQIEISIKAKQGTRYINRDIMEARLEDSHGQGPDVIRLVCCKSLKEQIGSKIKQSFNNNK